MNILLRIVADKRQEVDLRKSLIPVSQLERSVLFNRNTLSLALSLRSSAIGIIAEHKRRSPSKNIINQNFTVCEVAKGYENAGASGLSVLTDAKYFGGSLDDLIVARACCNLPILRKEFIIDTYQITEAKAHGADAILLIAAILTPKEIQHFSTFAKQLGLDVLLEIHNAQELDKSLLPSIDIIGVNNRDLNTFTVSLETSKTLSSLIPEEFVKISESGISSIDAVKTLQPFGYKGFLIGEHFMKTDNAGQSAKAFINQLKK
ncbi:indole-3-glycerol phosphate synthase TrpC [Bizionia gelidisalsuginis]|uniref:Indole-3-glycerol phosphate synthase n=1 Tax=Bizionia gelidisalsuginis TaxID=291188 RepID=A0ABY3MD19_9FLAO|nr:indole-3-glycerol phosphate synthase TrpC [Bizionia gelidisalsuginis]TYC16238.1 indole-3-glycerol phosphate synthase TrpC [Bizionia gelidisalsuginis]